MATTKKTNTAVYAIDADDFFDWLPGQDFLNRYESAADFFEQIKKNKIVSLSSIRPQDIIEKYEPITFLTPTFWDQWFDTSLEGRVVADVSKSIVRYLERRQMLETFIESVPFDKIDKILKNSESASPMDENSENDEGENSINSFNQIATKAQKISQLLSDVFQSKTGQKMYWAAHHEHSLVNPYLQEYSQSYSTYRYDGRYDTTHGNYESEKIPPLNSILAPAIEHLLGHIHILGPLQSFQKNPDLKVITDVLERPDSGINHSVFGYNSMSAASIDKFIESRERLLLSYVPTAYIKENAKDILTATMFTYEFSKTPVLMTYALNQLPKPSEFFTQLLDEIEHKLQSKAKNEVKIAMKAGNNTSNEVLNETLTKEDLKAAADNAARYAKEIKSHAVLTSLCLRVLGDKIQGSDLVRLKNIALQDSAYFQHLLTQTQSTRFDSMWKSDIKVIEHILEHVPFTLPTSVLDWCPVDKIPALLQHVLNESPRYSHRHLPAEWLKKEHWLNLDYTKYKGNLIDYQEIDLFKHANLLKEVAFNEKMLDIGAYEVVYEAATSYKKIRKNKPLLTRYFENKRSVRLFENDRESNPLMKDTDFILTLASKNKEILSYVHPSVWGDTDFLVKLNSMVDEHDIKNYYPQSLQTMIKALGDKPLSEALAVFTDSQEPQAALEPESIKTEERASTTSTHQAKMFKSI